MVDGFRDVALPPVADAEVAEVGGLAVEAAAEPLVEGQRTLVVLDGLRKVALVLVAGAEVAKVDRLTFEIKPSFSSRASAH